MANEVEHMLEGPGVGAAIHGRRERHHVSPFDGLDLSPETAYTSQEFLFFTDCV